MTIVNDNHNRFLGIFSVFISLLFVSFIIICIHSKSSSANPIRLMSSHPPKLLEGVELCEDFEKLVNIESKCNYLISNDPCVPQGFIDYLYIFYCICGDKPFLGYFLLIIWLFVMFYLLGNTASRYFCSSLEGLSRVLKLSPAIAGVTLLSLGNGAADVFASIVAFTGTGTREVGVSSILGGAFFVSSIVVGVISICLSRRSVRIDRSSFIRDVCFYLLVLGVLLLIFISGSINLWGSLCFVFLYFVYVFIVSAPFICGDKSNKDLVVPLLDNEEVLPSIKQDIEHNQSTEGQKRGFSMHCLNWFIFIVETPLYVPRRLTIPDVSEERWSKPFAVVSVILAPILLATLWNSQREDMTSEASLIIYMVAGLLGIVFCILAMKTTSSSSPPKKCLFPWLAGGFLMSVVWAYVTARELVSLLVSLGLIFGISPSILGLTVLAWGNSVSDLVANLAMAMNSGQIGAQIAISGSYAGPIFNTLVGLALSLLLSTWYSYPKAVMVPTDSAVYETLGFLCAGLLWALVILPRRRMKLDKVLGSGLLMIYLCFLCLRLSESLGLLPPKR